jgi:glycosyltransferase involved in cell wall biosynthesis
MTRRPRLSVVTISCNQAAFLPECIASVGAQKTADVEYILVDPGSTDGSREIARAAGTVIDRCIFAPDAGPADGLNKGFAAAQGEVFCYVNADDMVLPGAFAEALAWLDEHPGAAMVAGDGVLVDAAGAPLRRLGSDRARPLRMAFGGGLLIQPATFLRASAFRAAGGFNPANRIAWDGELAVEILRAGGRIGRSHRLWAAMRLHAGSITGRAPHRAARAEWAARRRTRLGYDWPMPAVRTLEAWFRLERVLRAPSRLSDRLRTGRVAARFHATGGGAG